MKKIFLDTNVILDMLRQRKPFVEASAAVWDLLERRMADGYVSAISFNNIHYIMRRSVSSASANQAMRIMMDTLNVIPLDGKVLSKAMDAAKFKDFEDAIQFFSAIQCNAEYLITRNVKDFPQTDIPALDPESFLALNLDFD
jgi:predicted nucleic acid-binding protein